MSTVENRVKKIVVEQLGVKEDEVKNRLSRRFYRKHNTDGSHECKCFLGHGSDEFRLG